MIAFRYKASIRFILVFIIISVIHHSGLTQNILHHSAAEKNWVDSVYNSLNLEQRIAQLMIVRANQPDKPYDPRIDSYIQQYNIGGVTFFKGSTEQQLLQTNRWQQLAKTPLFVSIDAEWGLSMRLSGTVSYPLQMTLGAVQNDDLIYQMGLQIAEQCARMGIHINFAPVIDVNNNAENPVIGMRSFGESPELVAKKGNLYAQALKKGGIIATAKHFPGHGDTKNDSHYSLPVIHHSRTHLDSIELAPFRYLINNEVDGIMIAHLNIPALDTTANLPSTLSGKIVSGLLKNELGFKGLIVTDGLDMKGVTSIQPSGTIELMALQAGNDILLLPENLPLAIQTIKNAVENGSLSVNRIEESCRKVLTYKYRAELNSYRPSYTEQLKADLNKKSYADLVNQLYAEAITLLKNEQGILPLKANAQNWALVSIGTDKASSMLPALKKHGLKITSFNLNKKSSKEVISSLRNNLNAFDHIIVNIENTSISASRKFGIEDEAIAFVNELAQSKTLVFNLFASPYALDFFTLNLNSGSIIIGYQDKYEAEMAVVEILTGKKQAMGKLPVSLKSGFKSGFGIKVWNEGGLNTIPDQKKNEFPEIKLSDNNFFKQIDSIVLDGIQKKAFPGCQVVALLHGNIIFQKAYGYFTYDSVEKVTDSTIFDLASLTKILASTAAVMKLSDEGKLQITNKISDYYPFLKSTDKTDIRLIDFMCHQSGFDGWIPFYLHTMTEEGLDSLTYSNKQQVEFPYKVAENLYINRKYKHTIFNEIANSKLKKKEYRYSDLGYYFIPGIVEALTNVEFDAYVQDSIYKPLGLNHLVFRPLTYFDASQIAPTEIDSGFRRQTLRGDVHDQGAAMMGGISGHAGLFGTAHDVALLMQMYLNGGSLNDRNMIKAETLNYFTNSNFADKNNRRGIGFDKPPLDPKEKIRGMSDAASMKSFGHTGFTGTFAWADPVNKLVVVFLSNRTYPDSKNNLLAKYSIRPKIHDVFYEYAKSQALKP